MDFSEIEASVRSTFDDNVPGQDPADRLWSQSEILEYARDGENEICERIDAIVDDTNSLTNVTVNTSTGTFGLASTIIAVKSAIMSLGTEPLMETTENILDLTTPSWRTETGTPRSYIKTPTNNIIIYPRVTVAQVINMTVSRFPITPMLVTGSPEIGARYHAGLILWILKRSYEKNDSETLNTGKARDYEKQFERFFGPKKILSD